jgi:serine/threonine protein kinase/Tfp pilus assembly protein PilF
MPEEPPSTVRCRPGVWEEPRTAARQLADLIVRRWHAGEEPPNAEKYLQLHPELLEYPEAGVHLVYEEACLRREAGEEQAYQSALDRFPQWRSQLEVMLQCHSLMEDEPTREPDWPVLGEQLGDFEVLAELGRGGLGRVYLARQHPLADRPVVLKISPRTGHEHFSLARLQHTHIVPLYSSQDDPGRNLRLLVMPYFGGAPLHLLLDRLKSVPLGRRSGAHLLTALDAEQARGPGEGTGKREQGTAEATSAVPCSLFPVPYSKRGPARTMLARLSYVEAVCWIGICLADALHYAHERGLLHLDVKPSNVLLAADGEPMLLDFNVAQGPIRPDGPLPEAMGGTPVYMPPEQEAALNALKLGRHAPSPVDRRADIYALGRLLYEALGGPAEGELTPPLERLNPQVSPGLSDVIGKCLAARPEDRYADAAALAADLRRHLNALPLRGVANRSWAERWRKWRRRRPQALTRIALVLVVLGAALGLGWWQLDYRRQQDDWADHERQAAEASLQQGRKHLDHGDFARAADVLERGLNEVQGVAESESLTAQLNAELSRARRAEAADRLHRLADRLRFLDAGTFQARGDASALGKRWRALWDKRTRLLDRQKAKLSATVESRMVDDLRDLATTWADLSVSLARPEQADAARLEALSILAEAEALFGPSVVLCRRQQVLAAALGREKEAKQAAERAARLKPRSAWEEGALGRLLLHEGRLDEAAAVLTRALDQEPGAFWPNFYQAVCAARRGRSAEAASSFGVALALTPPGSLRRAQCYYNRGLAREALKDDKGALHDYTDALKNDPHLASAALNRGALHYRQQRFAEALADLTRALRDGGDPALVHYDLALVHLARKDRAAALAEVDLALRANPRHVGAGQLRRRLTEGLPRHD